MKKTFLALALTGFAATSFASFDILKGQTGALWAGGFVETNYLAKSSDTTSASKVTEDKSSTRFRIRPRLDIGFTYYDDTIKAKLFVRNQFVVDQYQNKDKLTKKNTKSNPPVRYRFERIVAEIGTSKLGNLAVGKQATVGDYFSFHSDKAIVGHNTASYKFVMTGADRVIKYTTPYYNGAKADYSYANVKSSYGLTRQNAIQVSYKLNDVDVKFTGANDKSYNKNSNLTSNAKVYQLYAGTKFDALSVNASYTYAKKLSYKSDATQTHSSQQQRQQVAVYGKYSVNQYLTPYLGVSLLTDKTNSYTKAEVTKQKRVQGYFGISSTLYKQDNLAISGFVEGAVAKTKKDVTSVKEGKTTVVSSKTKEKEFGTGLKVSF